MAVYERTGRSFQQVVVSTTAVPLLVPEGMEINYVRLSVHTNAIRVRYDGGNPTPTMGHLVSASSGAVDLTRAIELTGRAMILAFRMVRDGNADAEVAYTCET